MCADYEEDRHACVPTSVNVHDTTALERHLLIDDDDGPLGAAVLTVPLTHAVDELEHVVERRRAAAVGPRCCGRDQARRALVVVLSTQHKHVTPRLHTCAMLVFTHRLMPVNDDCYTYDFRVQRCFRPPLPKSTANYVEAAKKLYKTKKVTFYFVRHPLVRLVSSFQVQRSLLNGN